MSTDHNWPDTTLDRKAYELAKKAHPDADDSTLLMKAEEYKRSLEVTEEGKPHQRTPQIRLAESE